MTAKIEKGQARDRVANSTPTEFERQDVPDRLDERG